MINRKIAIIGLGYVGLSLAAFLGNQVQVVGVDSNNEKIRTLEKGTSHFYEPKISYYLKRAIKKGLTFTDQITKEVVSSDFIFITVGTPIDKYGKIDLSNIKSVSTSIAKNMTNLQNNSSIIIKSTVIPGTTMHVVKPILEKNNLKESIDFGLLTNPEFLREGSAMQDTISPHAIVIGGSNNTSINKLTSLYKATYRKKPNIVETNNITAEVIKYANNAFLATKISFINSIANICQKIPGTDVDDIAKVMGMDPRISGLFLKAGPGYGGSCFPKDVQALISFSKSIGYNPELLEAVQDNNYKQIKTISDILEKQLGNLKDRKIGLLGLSFKENTDDIRESVSIRLIEHLLDKKSKIIVHDPKAISNTKEIFLKKITYCEKLEDVFKLSDCAVLMTPWDDYKKISSKLIKKLQSKLFIDTRRILKLHDKEIIFISLGIGRE